MTPDRPLAGRVIAVTRPRERSAGLVAALEAFGATVLTAPAVIVAPPASYDALDAALRRLPDYSAVAFTSAAAVDAAAERLTALQLSRPGEHVRLAAIGAATARASRLRFGRVDVTAGVGTAEGLCDALCEALPTLRTARVLFPRAERARDALPTVLRARGARVDAPVAYRTLDAPADALAAVTSAIDGATLDLVLLASPSAAGALARTLAEAGIAAGRASVACIGPTTAQAAAEHGFSISAVAATPSDDALVAAALRCLGDVRHPTPA